MKKILCLAVVILMLFVLASCDASTFFSDTKNTTTVEVEKIPSETLYDIKKDYTEFCVYSLHSESDSLKFAVKPVISDIQNLSKYQAVLAKITDEEIVVTTITLPTKDGEKAIKTVYTFDRNAYAYKFVAKGEYEGEAIITQNPS